MILTKEQILSANDCPSKQITVEDWGGEVFIKRLSAIELAGLDYLSGTAETLVQSIERCAKFVATFIVDEAGNRMFEEADIPGLLKRSRDSLSLVFTEGLKWNGLINEDSDV